jgi:hypothetical protein
MKFFVYEGSPKEIAELVQLMGKTAKNPAIMSCYPEEHEKPGELSQVLSVDQIKFVLTRRALGEPFRAILRQLYEAGDNRVKSDDLKNELKYTGAQFRGIFGAFARRLKKTPGIPNGARLFDEAWDGNLRQKTWALPPNVRRALEELNIV